MRVALRVGAAVACGLFWLLFVALVPSGAWSASETHGFSVPSRLSADHCGSSSDEPPPEEVHVCVTATPPTETETVVVTEPGPTVTETATVTVVEPSDAACGTEDTPPCDVELAMGEDPWLLIACCAGVALLAAGVVSHWGDSS